MYFYFFIINLIFIFISGFFFFFLTLPRIPREDDSSVHNALSVALYYSLINDDRRDTRLRLYYIMQRNATANTCIELASTPFYFSFYTFDNIKKKKTLRFEVIINFFLFIVVQKYGYNDDISETVGDSCCYRDHGYHSGKDRGLPTRVVYV